jgi:hypothetical protein
MKSTEELVMASAAKRNAVPALLRPPDSAGCVPDDGLVVGLLVVHSEERGSSRGDLAPHFLGGCFVAGAPRDDGSVGFFQSHVSSAG